MNGMLHCADVRWKQCLRLATDCHSANLLLNGSGEGRVIRRVPKGSELEAWFSHDLLFKLEIPYLSLSNIHGKTKP